MNMVRFTSYRSCRMCRRVMYYYDSMRIIAGMPFRSPLPFRVTVLVHIAIVARGLPAFHAVLAMLFGTCLSKTVSTCHSHG